MAWSAPRTWVTGEVVTAALMNAEIRDNFLETSAATVTTAGDIAFADAANSMGSRVAIGAATRHLVSTGTAPVWRGSVTDVEAGPFSITGTSYGVFVPSVVVTVTSGTKVLVLWKAELSNDTAGSVTRVSYSVSGATTSAASNTRAIAYESGAADDSAEFGGFDLRTVTAGSNTYTLEVRVTANTGTAANVELAVVAY